MDNLAQAGLDSEKEVMDWLRDLGHIVEPSTIHDNIYKDIDCIVDGLTCSIKTDFKAEESGRIVFELMVKLRTGDWKNSWYHNSEARVYLFRVGNAIYLCRRLPPKYKMFVTTLSDAEQARQISRGHFHISATLGLMRLSVLVSEGTFVHYGDIDDKRQQVATNLLSYEGGQVFLPRDVPKPTLKAGRPV